MPFGHYRLDTFVSLKKLDLCVSDSIIQFALTFYHPVCSDVFILLVSVLQVLADAPASL